MLLLDYLFYYLLDFIIYLLLLSCVCGIFLFIYSRILFWSLQLLLLLLLFIAVKGRARILVYYTSIYTRCYIHIYDVSNKSNIGYTCIYWVNRCILVYMLYLNSVDMSWRSSLVYMYMVSGIVYIDTEYIFRYYSTQYIAYCSKKYLHSTHHIVIYMHIYVD